MVSNCRPMWRTITCAKTELQLDITLACGQSFRWKENKTGEWSSVLSGKIWTLKQDEENLYFKVEGGTVNPTPKKDSRTKLKKTAKQTKAFEEALSSQITAVSDTTEADDTYENILRDYFQLQYHLKDLYEQWGNADSIFKDAASTFTGVRMLRQDPVENLFSFICSSNNHISRISGMVERMCEAYGTRLTDTNEKQHYTFPSIASLARPGVDENLRKLGFGYRAKYISTSAQILAAKEPEWLYSLRNRPYEEAKSELMQLCGVGAKVADCVCLMSLDKLGAIPVDTHVWQIAARHYMPKLNSAKSLTPTLYNQIGNHFRSIWGDLAGWTHSILFSADLKKFQNLKPDHKKRRRETEVTDSLQEKLKKTKRSTKTNSQP